MFEFCVVPYYFCSPRLRNVTLRDLIYYLFLKQVFISANVLQLVEDLQK